MTYCDLLNPRHHYTYTLFISGKGLWNEEDGFYYDHLRFPDGHYEVMRVRSMVGLIPLFACLVLEDEVVQRLPGFKRRMQWFMRNQPDLAKQASMSNILIHSILPYLDTLGKA